MTSSEESSRPPVISTRGPYGSLDDNSNDGVDDSHRSNDGSRGVSTDHLQRGLSARQVQMIAIGGTIGTGLFLGTGRSLAQGGPGSVLVCYGLVGFIVYVTLLLLGEMGTQYPVAGSFTSYSARFFSPSYAFALSWNYWFNDAVSVASDLTAAQLVLQFWTESNPWVISLVFLLFLLGVNAIHVNSYGEMEYILSTLKVATIVAFIIVGACVDLGLNRERRFIGFSNWEIPGAPFVDGIQGFARVFVTASFAYGGTESLGITAGETRNPTKNMPRVVKFVFWRILLFYVLSIFMIGLNVPYDYPNLSNRSTTTSPFTIVFYEAGSNVAASFMNTVILSSVLSAGNHAMFAGTRVLFSLASSSPRLAPKVFAHTNSRGVPIYALLGTSSISGLCFASSFIGGGVLWGWLQNIVGVSNQIAWLSIGLASWRFRQAWVEQGRPLEEMKFRAGWTWPWGPPFVVISTSILILFQGWSSVFPKFSFVDFLSLYVEVPVMVIMICFFVILRPGTVYARGRQEADSRTPLLRTSYEDRDADTASTRRPLRAPLFDIVPTSSIDLYRDEHQDDEDDQNDDAERTKNLTGKWALAWRLWYKLA